MSGSTGRSARWWDIAAELAPEPDEPWAAAADGTWDHGLTDDQAAVLAGLEDQPPVPRLRRVLDLDDE